MKRGTQTPLTILAEACFALAQALFMAGAPEQTLPLMDEAQKRFDALERGDTGRGAEARASDCIAGQGRCLTELGRLDQAADAFEESIRRGEKIGHAHQVAVGKNELGTVRRLQGRYTDALQAHRESREQFTRLGNLQDVAVSWNQTGIAHQWAGQPEAAENAYRESLAIKGRLGDVTGQAITLLHLGILYDEVLGRLEEAVAFYRQGADKFFEIRDLAKEGTARSNLALTLRKLGRLDEARQEILRAIKCTAQFGHASKSWNSWAILAGIETEALNAAAAAEARRKATACYLAYRRDGGENQALDGRICLQVARSLHADDPAAAASRLQELAASPQLPAWIRPFIKALQAIAAGSRDPRLADSPRLSYTMAAEILLLLETLEKCQ